MSFFRLVWYTEQSMDLSAWQATLFASLVLMTVTMASLPGARATPQTVPFQAAADEIDLLQAVLCWRNGAFGWGRYPCGQPAGLCVRCRRGLLGYLGLGPRCWRVC